MLVGSFAEHRRAPRELVAVQSRIVEGVPVSLAKSKYDESFVDRCEAELPGSEFAERAFAWGLGRHSHSDARNAAAAVGGQGVQRRDLTKVSRELSAGRFPDGAAVR